MGARFVMSPKSCVNSFTVDRPNSGLALGSNCEADGLPCTHALVCREADLK